MTTAITPEPRAAGEAAQGLPALLDEGQLLALRIKADSWMRECGADLPRSGYVVIYRGKVSGWQDKIRDPHHNVAGCYAVAVAGNDVWVTIGGDYWNGAEHWYRAGTVDPLVPTKEGAS